MFINFFSFQAGESAQYNLDCSDLHPPQPWGQLCSQAAPPLHPLNHHHLQDVRASLRSVTSKIRTQSRARKIFSVPVAEFFWPDTGAIFFWSHFLSSWSQSRAKPQKVRRKEKKKSSSLRAAFAHIRTRMSSMTR